MNSQEHLIKALEIYFRLKDDQMLSPNNMPRRVSEMSGVSIKELVGKGKRRSNDVVFYRQALGFLLRERGLSYRVAASLCGLECHATIIYSCRKMKDYIESYWPPRLPENQNPR